MLLEIYKKPYWKYKKEEIAKILNVNLNSGIKNEEVLKRKELFGRNEYIEEDRLRFVKIVLEEILDPFNLILLSASLLSFLVGELLDFIIIFLVFIVNVTISISQRFLTEKSLEKLKSKLENKVLVIRNGKIISIDAKDLVVGDLVILDEGDKVPADIRVIEESNLYVDESTLTGEKILVKKWDKEIEKENINIYEAKNILFSQTYIAKGKCKGIVIAVGKNTYFGKIIKELREEKDESLFLNAIKNISKDLLKVGYITLVFVLSLLLVRGFDIIDSIILAIAFSIGIIPENLPLIVNFTLARFSSKLAKKGLFVRRLYVLEELGEIDLIVSDKTGTLTKNLLKLREVFSYTSTKKVLEYFILASTIEVKDKNIMGDEIEKQVAIYYKDKYGINNLVNLINKKREILEFDYKFMRNGCKLNNLIIYKGAPEKIIEDCNYIEVKDNIEEIYKYKSELNRKLDEFFKEGYRVLGLMYVINNKKVFLGFVALEDEIKEGIKETIEELKKLGVGIKVITGDNKLVALAVARKVGLDIKEEDIVEGDKLYNLPFEDFLKVIKEKIIFSRVTPDLKGKIVDGLKYLGFKVAAIGDGINDLLMIKKAYLGIAVENAEDILKDNADVVIARKDLGIILEGIKLGRQAFKNIRDYLAYTLSGNAGDLLYLLVAVLILSILPLKPIHVLLINVITDSLPAILLLTTLSKDFYSLVSWNFKKLYSFILKSAVIEESIGFLLIALLYFNNLFKEGVVWNVIYSSEILMEYAIFLHILRNRFNNYKEMLLDKKVLTTTIFILTFLLLTSFLFKKYLYFSSIPSEFFILILFSPIILLYILEKLKLRNYLR